MIYTSMFSSMFSLTFVFEMISLFYNRRVLSFESLSSLSSVAALFLRSKLKYSCHFPFVPLRKDFEKRLPCRQVNHQIWQVKFDFWLLNGYCVVSCGAVARTHDQGPWIHP